MLRHSRERLLTRSIAVGMLSRFVRSAKDCFFVLVFFFLRDFVWAGYIDMACAELGVEEGGGFKFLLLPLLDR